MASAPATDAASGPESSGRIWSIKLTPDAPQRNVAVSRRSIDVVARGGIACRGIGTKLLLATPPCRNCILPLLTMRFHVRTHHRSLKRVPFLRPQVREVGDEFELLERVAVKLAVHGLNLHERQFGIEFDRHVGAGEANVGEQ